MKKRYIVSKFAQVSFIQDVITERIFAFGRAEYDAENQRHRNSYDVSDAYHIIDWLNERAAGYPSGPPLRVRLP